MAHNAILWVREMTRKHIKLGVMVPISGVHYGGWRHPLSQPERATDIEYYGEIARKAEAGKLDVIFLADSIALYEGTAEEQDRAKHALMRAEPKRLLEPLTLLSALSTMTRHIGLASTATTTYNEPYTIARLFASLDHISNGRAGWNVVTSANVAEAHNFSRDSHVGHAERYDRAREFMKVALQLWDSIDDGAFLIDKATGLYGDEKKVRPINHRGKHFSVRGPLNVPRPPQGHPVIFQAGSSGPGVDLAAETADVVFTAQQTLDSGKRFYSSVKERAAAFGRNKTAPKIMPGIVTYVAGTEAEAKAKYDLINELVDPEFGLYMLSDLLGGVDLTRYHLDGPLPDEIPASNGSQSRRDMIINLARRENLTIRQLYQRISGASGHRTLIGTPETIVDQMELWFNESAADGFIVLPPSLPSGLDDFVDLVIPELQRRKLFRREYEGTTLRENLELPRPANTLS